VVHASHLSCAADIGRTINIKSWPCTKTQEPIKKSKKGLGVAQVVECLHSKHKALNLNLSATKRKEGRKEIRKGEREKEIQKQRKRKPNSFECLTATRNWVKVFMSSVTSLDSLTHPSFFLCAKINSFWS
jgi:hypothetical protein